MISIRKFRGLHMSFWLWLLVLGGFPLAGRGAKTDESQAYIRNYFAGDPAPALTPFWAMYVCTLANHTAKAFAACVCPAVK